LGIHSGLKKLWDGDLFVLTIYSDSHRLHHGHGELIFGELRPCFEKPVRADMILERVRAAALGEVRAPTDFGSAPLVRVHTPDYVHFLETAWDQWSQLGYQHDALPMSWPVHGLRNDRPPTHIEGKVGYYAFDAGAPITAGTWEATRQSANVALTAASALNSGVRSAFALCRPPGHHAGKRWMGGYCYLNNAAIAAQYLRDAGAKRVAILDVDHHHGNGTQDIFYDRSDVLFVSIHADPLIDYPFFLGHADETGTGAGLGFNLNIPLPQGTPWSAYDAALQQALQRIKEFAPDALIVSLGVDTFEQDPHSKFKLAADDFATLGERISRLKLPTVFAMEGGYAVEELGVNAVNVLLGFEQA
jgi:acetoin utilization deacetylase AcuC-like enzyme